MHRASFAIQSLLLRLKDLSGANLSAADLREASLIETNLIAANLSNADLRGSLIKNIDMTRAKLEGVKLDKGRSL